ncbi:MAG: YfhO family protein [Candidatus Neomarinimicrobiota bacterium]
MARFSIVVIPAAVFLFLNEMVISGKTPLAPDYLAHYPIKKWGEEFIREKGEMPQWYPHLFSGAPSYAGYMYMPSDLVANVLRPVFVNLGVKYWFYFSLGGVGMFLFLRRRRLGYVPALFGSAVYGLTPYLFGLINAGHGIKILSLGYLPYVFLMVEYIFARSSWRGVLYLSLATALQIWAKHPQVVYYTWMLVVFLWIWRQVKSLLGRTWSRKREGIQTGAIFGGLILALMMVVDPNVPVYQYQGHSTRGSASALQKTKESERGTSWDYATQWSFHPKESVSFIYPYFHGLQNYPTRDLKSAAYWGRMPFTQSTHYLGLLTVVLAVLALTIRKPSGLTLSMAIATVLILLVGFGRHFPPLYWSLYKFAPLFSGFRIPSMIFVLLPFTMGVLAATGLENLMEILEERIAETVKRLRLSVLLILGPLIGLSLVFLLIGDSTYEALGLFVKSGDAERFQPQVLAQLAAVRKEIFHRGLLLAFFVSIAGLTSIWLGIRQHLNGKAVGLILLSILMVDLWVVDREFLHLKNPVNLPERFRTTPEIDFMRRDSSLFRILPADEMNSNRHGYFGLSSVGGYRPVKLRTYQDLMDGGGLSSLPVLNMLNVKYLVTSRQLQPRGFQLAFSEKQSVYRNLTVLPKAWLVSQVDPVSSQEESLRKTTDPAFDPAVEAVVINYDGPEFEPGGMGTVEVRKYSENEIILEASSPNGGLLVLSENYYGPGWKATVDNEPVRIYQTNHVLRSVVLPAGGHSITFEYDTKLFRICRAVSRIVLSAVLLVILFINRDKLVRVALRFRSKV